jgi:hypothetical protein
MIYPGFPIWLRRLAHQLRSVDIVKDFRLRPSGIAIYYANGATDRISWLPTKAADPEGGLYRGRRIYVPRPEGRLKYVLRPIRQYENQFGDIDDNDRRVAHHYILRAKHLAYGSLVDKLLGLNRLVSLMLKDGYRHHQHPTALSTDLQALLAYDSNRCWRNGRVLTSPGPPRVGRAIVEHFFQLGEVRYGKRPSLAEAFASPQLLSSAAKRALSLSWHTRRGISTASLGRMVSRYLAGPRLWQPGTYLAAFRNLLPAGREVTVVDFNPGTGHKALACAALGLRYTIHPQAPGWEKAAFGRAVDSGFPAYVGLKGGGEAQGGEDLLIVDNHFETVDLPEAIELARPFKRLLAYGSGTPPELGKCITQVPLEVVRRPGWLGIW